MTKSDAINAKQTAKNCCKHTDDVKRPQQIKAVPKDHAHTLFCLEIT